MLEHPAENGVVTLIQESLGGDLGPGCRTRIRSRSRSRADRRSLLRIVQDSIVQSGAQTTGFLQEAPSHSRRHFQQSSQIGGPKGFDRLQGIATSAA